MRGTEMEDGGPAAESACVFVWFAMGNDPNVLRASSLSAATMRFTRRRRVPLSPTAVEPALLPRKVRTGQPLTGGRALLVRAIDEEAIGFWSRRGFLSSPADPYLLFRSFPDTERRAACRSMRSASLTPCRLSPELTLTASLQAVR